MKIITNLRNWLYEPLVHGVSVDDNALLAIHMEVLRKKPLLRSAFETFYRDMIGLCDRLLAPHGMEVELGSGAGFFKSMRDGLVTSDIRKGPHIDMELDMPSTCFTTCQIQSCFSSSCAACWYPVAVAS